jgi:hypothetical protein
MTQTGKADGPHRGARWTLLVWSGAALLLLAPLVAMQFTREVNWSPADFAIFGLMLLVACGLLELVVRLTQNGRYRLIAGIGIAGVFLFVWAQLAVGIIG